MPQLIKVASHIDQEPSNHDFLLDPRDDFRQDRPQPINEIKTINIGEQVLKIRGNLDPEEEKKLKKVLADNIDLFAWTLKDVPGIDPNFICHNLTLDERVNPVAQARRRMSPEKNKAVKIEVAKLLEAGFIREIQYPTWLTNLVMVKKARGKWRMCTDYTDLNKHCPKDAYPLPSVNSLVHGASV